MKKVLLSILSFLICQVSISQVNSIFSISPSNGCSPLAVSFTDMSTGGPTSWNWSFGNGNTSTQQNPGAVYITPGNYIISLTVSDGLTSSTSFDTVTVYNNPAVDFIADDSIGCSNLNVSFTNLSITGTGIASALWNFGDGNTSTAINPSHSFGDGIFDITLIVTDSSGCITQLDKLSYINSISAPIVDFSATNTQNCFIPNTVTFTNNSTNDNGASYLWDFGDGNTSNIENPVHTYNAFGSYDVKLVVNKNGCSDSLILTNFVVLTPQDADFTSDFTSRCVGQAIQFTDMSALAPDSYSWDFGDGTPASTAQNPSHTYNTAGVYTVTLTANKLGCDDVETKLNYITINDNPTVSFVADRTDTCGAPFLVNFTSTTSAVSSYNWDFGDGNTSILANPTHTYNSPGSYNVSLTVTNASGCTSSSSQNGLINIVPPVANFIIDSAFGCNPKTVQITDISTSPNGIATWLWDFGDGTTQNGPNNPNHTFIDTGIYNISLIVIDNNGCSDTLSPGLPVEVGQNFAVDFSATPTVACKIDPITFTNLTDTLLVDNVTWRWDFGDGGILQTYDAIYQYGDTGVFEVTLTAFHNGCASSFSIPDLITINPPIALFSTDVSCDNFLEVSFIDESIEPETWLWDINGDTILSQNTNYIFPSVGNYNATLYVENFTYGCLDSISSNINIQEPTLGFFSNDSLGCAPFNVQFTDTSSLAVSWTWDFGDGNTSTAQNPSNTYNNFGVYDVSLIVENTYGCFDTITYNQMITVIGSTPNFNATDTSGCRDFTANFNDLSSSIAGPITDWLWDFGDGNTSILQNPDHTYTDVGSFDVSLTITDSAGCMNSFSRIDYITATGPIPDFSNTNLSCVNSAIVFTNNSTSLGGTITNWNWNFGDGNTSTLENPTHTYANSGNYDVTLFLEDDNGCDTTYQVNNAISIDTMIVDFSADSTIGNCTGFIVNFEEDVNPNPISWTWDFGNGNTSNIPNPSVVFSSVGDFDVTLIAENAAGCIDTIVKPDFITVNGPIGLLTVSEDTGCVDLDVDFNIISPNSVNQVWDMGDGTVVSNNTLNFSHTYTNVNTFFPLVILEDADGCQIPYYFDTIYTGSLEALMYIDTNYLCTPDIVNFADSSQSTPPVQSWNWSFGDGNVSNIQNPNHTYTTDGIFDISLIVDNGLCADTLTEIQYLVSDSSTIAEFSFNLPALMCPPLSIPFNDLSASDSSILNWNWDFGNGTTANIQNPGNINYNDAGNYTISLDITSIKGCTSSFIDSFVINEIPEFNFDLDTIILCFGDDTTLAPIEENTDITWTPTNNLSCSDCPDPTIFGVNSTTYFVNATSEFGCTFDDTLELIVSNLPPLTVSEDQNVLEGTEVRLSAFSPGFTNFSWTPNDNLSCNNCADNTFTANETTEIIVSITDSLGCENVDTILVEVFNMCDDGFLLFPNVFTPNNDGKNDVFKVTRRSNLEPEINYFRIFDRWGKLLFETQDIEETWDGTFNGTPLNNGVYVYVVDVVCSDGNNQLFNGNVTIIR